MRGKRAKPREIEPDPRYHDKKVAKFINYLMRDGKKTIARRILYNAFSLIEEKAKEDPLKVFFLAIENVAPKVEVRPRRIGGGNYQIPFPTSERRSFTLACRWIIEAARARKGKPMEEKLAQELLEASQNQGAAVAKKNNVYRMAEANRAFAHLAYQKS